MSESDTTPLLYACHLSLHLGSASRSFALKSKCTVRMYFSKISENIVKHFLCKSSVHKKIKLSRSLHSTVLLVLEANYIYFRIL